MNILQVHMDLRWLYLCLWRSAVDKNRWSGFHLSLRSRFRYRRPWPCTIVRYNAWMCTNTHNRALSCAQPHFHSRQLCFHFRQLCFARRLTSFLTRRLAPQHHSTVKTSTQPAENKVRANRNEFAAVRDCTPSYANVHDRARMDTIVRNSTSSRAIVHNRVCLRIAVNLFSLTCVLVFAVTRALNWHRMTSAYSMSARNRGACKQNRVYSCAQPRTSMHNRAQSCMFVHYGMR